MSTQETTKQLISRLCNEHSEVKCLGCPYKRAVTMILIVFIYNAVMVLLDTMRGDMNQIMTSTTFLFEISLSLLISITTFIAISLMMIPDMAGKKWFLTIPMTLLGVFLMWMGTSFFDQGHIQEHVFPNSGCFKDGILYALLPIAIVIWKLKNGATTHSSWTIFLSIISVTFVGWISLRLVCQLDTPSHIFINHFLPFVAVGAATGLFARKYFSW